MPDSILLLEKDAAIATITFNNPKALKARKSQLIQTIPSKPRTLHQKRLRRELKRTQMVVTLRPSSRSCIKKMH